MGHPGALLGRLVGLCWAVWGPSKSDAKTRSMKAPFLEDVSSEIAVLGTQEGVLNPGGPDLNPLGTPPGLFLPTNGSHAKRAFRYLLSTGRKAPLFWRGCGIALLSVIPALPPPLSLALLSSYSFYPYPCVVRPHVCPSWPSWGLSWMHLGASWEPLRSSRGRLGTAWSALGPSWGLLDPL